MHPQVKTQHSSQHELLLPVGTYEMALAAIHNGADAIYLGVPGFNARGRSYDFEMQELKKIIQTCHLYGVRAHLAFNIVIFENELPQVIEVLKEILPLKPDALIVQDLGLAQIIRELSPDQIIHASTQMTITNHEAISLLEDLNIRRFVLGRENSLDEIRLIREKTDKDLEVFVHGALCVSYSGQCFTSESIGGRSANRGQCAQSCRFAYNLFVDGEKKQMNGRDYLVSPQDLCGIEQIPELIDIGVQSFKVEGRLKSPEYVASATQEYRDAIDRALVKRPLTGQELSIAKQHMGLTYSRGFFSGWLKGVDHQHLVEGTYSAHRGVEIAKVIEVHDDSLVIESTDNLHLHPGDGLVWVFRKRSHWVEKGGFIYQVHKISQKKIEVFFSTDLKLDRDTVGARVYFNHDKELKKDLQRSFTDKHQFKKIPVTLKVEIEIGKPLTAVMMDGVHSVSAQTASPIELAKTKGTTDLQIKEELGALSATAFDLHKCELKRATQDPIYVSQKEIKEVRRHLSESLANIRSEFEHARPQFDQVKIDTLLQPRPRPASSKIKLNVLLREKDQVLNLVQAIRDGQINKADLGTVILDFEFGRDYLSSLEELKKSELRTGVATTRILKPQEYNNLKSIQKMNPDVILVRNLGALQYFTKTSPFSGDLIGDFSLNVTNHLTADYLLKKGLQSLCLSYDLNKNQIDDVLQFAPAEKLEITVHQYMPSFHMEHCVFAMTLSEGSSWKDCGKPCEQHKLELEDQFGNRHQIKPDQECRNTMYNAVSQSAAKYLPEWQSQGLGFARYEALRERNDELIGKIQTYIGLINQTLTVNEASEKLGKMESYGLSEGSLSRLTEYQSRKR